MSSRSCHEPRPCLGCPLALTSGREAQDVDGSCHAPDARHVVHSGGPVLLPRDLGTSVWAPVGGQRGGWQRWWRAAHAAVGRRPTARGRARAARCRALQAHLPYLVQGSSGWRAAAGQEEVAAAAGGGARASVRGRCSSWRGRLVQLAACVLRAPTARTHLDVLVRASRGEQRGVGGVEVEGEHRLFTVPHDLQRLGPHWAVRACWCTRDTGNSCVVCGMEESGF